MKVPFFHYIRFWAYNSFLAFGTGFVIGYLFQNFFFFLLSPITFPFAFLFVYQYFIASFFWGDRRGAFEFSYLERVASTNKFNPALATVFKEVKQEYKLGDPQSALQKLQKAASYYSSSFAVQFKLAIACEKLGLGDEAITAYKNALAVVPNNAPKLLQHVIRQIEHVRTKGPRRKSSAPGLQMVIY